MDKKRINKLIPIANNFVYEIVERGRNEGKIKESYDGKISAFGVSVALSGILPTLAMYYNESSTSVKTRPILEILAKMIEEDKTYPIALREYTAKSIVEHAISGTMDEKKFTNIIIECAIALKQVVRTYEKSND